MASQHKYETLFPQPQLNSQLTTSRFQGNVVIVTGGASGIGRATVERFCNDGAFAAIFDLDENLGFGLERHLVENGQQAKFYKVDVSDKDRCLQAVKHVADANDGQIHFIVNCAMYYADNGKAFLDITSETLGRYMNVNVVGVANMVQASQPFMKKGVSAIVNIASVRGHRAVINQSAYSVSKSALSMLGKCIALDLSSYGIRVNTVSPGAVLTPSTFNSHVENVTPSMKEKAEKICEHAHIYPCKFIEAAGVASVITFLCSKDAMYIDGADIPVDCGYLAMGPENNGR